MSRVEDIEKAIRDLRAGELQQFRRWFAEFDAEYWDTQIEADAASGKLDALANQALDDHTRGQSREL